MRSVGSSLDTYTYLGNTASFAARPSRETVHRSVMAIAASVSMAASSKSDHETLRRPDHTLRVLGRTTARKQSERFAEFHRKKGENYENKNKVPRSKYSYRLTALPSLYKSPAVLLLLLLVRCPTQRLSDLVRTSEFGLGYATSFARSLESLHRFSHLFVSQDPSRVVHRHATA